METLSCELVRALRGSLTQLGLSRRLGFDSNVVYMWESGRRAPEASRFFRMAELSGKDRAHRSFFHEASLGLSRARLSTLRGVSHLVGELVGAAAHRTVASRIGVDRSTLARWLQAKSEPRLPDLLRLIQATTQRLLPYLKCFAQAEELPSARAALLDLEQQKRLAFDVPWSHAVLRVLELSEYGNLPRHSDSFVARHLGMSESKVRMYLEALAEAGQLVKRDGRWTISRVLTVDTREEPKKNVQLKAHWASVALERLRTGKHQKDALFSYNLFAVSSENLGKIRALHLEYYDAVRALVEQSERADEVVLLNAQLLSLRPEDVCG